MVPRDRIDGAEGQNRTVDTSLFRAVLCQLSYLGIQAGRRGGVSVYRIIEEKSTFPWSVWRRGRDLNPRQAFDLCRFSKPVPSAARPPLHNPSYAKSILAVSLMLALNQGFPRRRGIIPQSMECTQVIPLNDLRENFFVNPYLIGL
ncbi:MAG: hypothetical protein K0S45_2479 [Nitrospira sp.]|nr:hypothetical protein [Nitrospira sp.]